MSESTLIIPKPDLKATFLTFYDLDSQLLLASRNGSAQYGSERIRSAAQQLTKTPRIDTRSVRQYDDLDLDEIPEDTDTVEKQQPVSINRSGRELENLKALYSKRNVK